LFYTVTITIRLYKIQGTQILLLLFIVNIFISYTNQKVHHARYSRWSSSLTI